VSLHLPAAPVPDQGIASKPLHISSCCRAFLFPYEQWVAERI
jgi:hypothetical protein